MTIPNKLTVLRIILTPVFLVFFFIDGVIQISPLWYGIGVLSLFSVMELSDLFDGLLARKLNQTTEIGKVLDPFADSISRLTYFLCFTFSGIMPLWVFSLILYRDLWVAFIRQLYSRGGGSMAARLSGKLKAVAYAAAGLLGIFFIVFAKLNMPGGFLGVYRQILIYFFYLTGGAALWSMIDYSFSLKGHSIDL